MKPTLLFIHLALVVLATQAFARGGVPLWANRYSGPGARQDIPTAIAVDGNGNVYVTGESEAANGFADFVTVAYSNSGVALWTNRYNGSADGADYATDIAVASNGSVVVTGSSATSTMGFDCLTISYSSSGVALWTNRFNGSGNGDDLANAVAVDGGGNAFVTGTSYGYTNGFNDCVTIKYSSAGVPLWTNLYDGPTSGSDSGSALVVDTNGNVFVTGGSDGSNGKPDFVTIKYSNQGLPLWTNRYNGPANDIDGASAIAVDGVGDVYVAGTSLGIGSQNDFAIIKYASNGTPLWTNRYNSPANRDDGVSGMVVDPSGRAFVTGYSEGATYPPPYGRAYATIGYSSAGVPLWTNRYKLLDDGIDGASAIALDSAGNVFVTGGSQNTNAISVFTEYATVAYSRDGLPLWTNRYAGPGGTSLGAKALAVDSTGNLFATGGDYLASSYFDYATVKYSSSSTLPWLGFQRQNNQLVLSWTNAGFTLQSAPAVTGLFTNIFGVATPHTNPITGGQQFFRLISK